MFRDLRGVFVMGHDGKTHLVLGHRFKDILPVPQHLPNEITPPPAARNSETFFDDTTDNPTNIHMFLIEGSQTLTPCEP